MNIKKILVIFIYEIQNNNNSNDLKGGMQFSNAIYLGVCMSIKLLGPCNLVIAHQPLKSLLLLLCFAFHT